MYAHQSPSKSNPINGHALFRVIVPSALADKLQNRAFRDELNSPEHGREHRDNVKVLKVPVGCLDSGETIKDLLNYAAWFCVRISHCFVIQIG